MDKQLTAMQMNIAKIDSFINYVTNSEGDSQMKEDFLIIFNSIKNNAIECLAKEKEQMANTFHAGFFVTQWDKSKEDKFEQYYSKTYKNYE